MHTSAISPIDAWRRDRRFFTGLAVVAAVVVFAGFARTYFLKPWFGTPAIPAVLHLHGALMTSWLLLLIAQTSLVAMKRTDLHRRLGVAGAVLAAVIVVAGVAAVIMGLRVPFGTAAVIPTVALTGLASMVQFAGFVGAALLNRRNPDAHKRLILIATAVLLTSAVGRLIGVWLIRHLGLGGPSPIIALAVCGASDMLVVAMIVYDLVTRRRVHRSLIWGGLALVVAQYLAEAARFTNAGQVFVAWLKS